MKYKRYLFFLLRRNSWQIVSSLLSLLQEQGAETAIFAAVDCMQTMPESMKTKYRFLHNLKEIIDYKAEINIVPGREVDWRIPGLNVHLFNRIAPHTPLDMLLDGRFDLICSPGHYFTEKLLVMRKSDNFPQIKETGWQKTDYISQSKILSDDTRLPDNRKIIIYAPARKSKGGKAHILLSLFPALIKKDEFWIIRFSSLAQIKLMEKYRKVLPENSHIVIRDDILPYAKQSNLLLSDNDSLIYEYLLLDKPVITFHTRLLPTKGIEITNPQLLRKAIDESLNDPQINSYNRQECLKLLHHQLSESIAEKTLSCLNKFAPERENKHRFSLAYRLTNSLQMNRIYTRSSKRGLKD